MIRLRYLLFLCLGSTLAILAAGATQPGQPFITRVGDKLMEGDQEFRFVSFNHPNLHISENPVWRRMTPWEQEDAVRSIAQMGGRVVRLYTLSIRGGKRNGDGLSHVYAPGKYDETLLQDYDRVIALCRQYGVRVIIPFIDEWDWFGGLDEFCRFRGRTKRDFYTDPQIQADYRALIRMLVTRTNTITHVAYNEDPTIMVWETGNELRNDPPAWVGEIAAYIKSLAPHQLVQDGHADPRPEVIADGRVDLVTAHYYGGHDYVAAARRDRELTRGRIPFYVGEYDPRHGAAVLDEVVRNGSAGILAWSLRGHAAEGGFFCHFDPLYYHWPHSPLTRDIRRAAFAIRGLSEPAWEVPPTPELLPIQTPRQITWRGSTGAEGYQLERAPAPEGPWTILATDISDNACSGSTLFDDEQAPDARNLFYRLKARNRAGESAYSPVVRSGH